MDSILGKFVRRRFFRGLLRPEDRSRSGGH